MSVRGEAYYRGAGPQPRPRRPASRASPSAVR